MMVLLTVGTLSVVSLGSYLELAQSQSASILRSQAWNSALPLAEAGLEDALSHINTATNLASDGWTNSGSVYSRQQNLGAGYYCVSISNNAAQGVVTVSSTGYQFWKTGTYIGRTVQMVKQAPIWEDFALSAQNVGFNGGFLADSYNSANPLYSTTTNLAAYDSKKITAQAVVAVYSPGLNVAVGGGGTIYGTVEYPPGGTATSKGSSSVGDLAWVNGGNKNIESGHSVAGFTNTPPDVVVPPSLMSARAPTNGIVGGTNYNYVLNGNYNSPTLDAGGSSTTIYVQGNSTVYVPGNISVSTLVFAPNATLTLYVAESTLSFTPTVIGGLPPQITVYGTPTCTSMTMTAHDTFIGFLYAPEMTLKANGSALYGALTIGTLSCQGQFNLHYDCGITNNASAGAKFVSWTEL